MSYMEDEEHIKELEILKKVIPNISDFFEHVGKHSSQIVWPNPNQPLNTEYGCGTFAVLANVYGILTAAHVAEIFERHETDRLYIPNINSKDFGLIALKFRRIIKMPDIDGMSSIDLAFIELDDHQEVIAQGKQFVNLDDLKERSLDFVKTKIDALQCCGFLGAPSDGKELIKEGGREYVHYPKASVFCGDIQKHSYATHPFFFPISFGERLSEIEFRYDEFKAAWTQRRGMPAFFNGTSGSGFWGAELVHQDGHYVYGSPILLGVVILENSNRKELICRGPVSIYETFSTYCTSYLKGDSLDDALLAAKAGSIDKPKT